MKATLYRLSLHAKRVIIRNPAFYFFDVGMPLFFYLLFTNALPVAGNSNADKVAYLISMTIYGILLGSVMTGSHLLGEDNTTGFLKTVILSPLSLWRHYCEMMVILSVLNVSCIGLIGIVAILVNHVALNFWVWVALLVVLPIASVPLIGIAILLS